jgi:hypothetical protein
VKNYGTERFETRLNNRMPTIGIRAFQLMDEIAVSNYQLEITAPLSLAGVSQADLIDSNSIAFRFLCGEDNFLCPSARVCISISTVPESACSRSAVELQILALQLRKISTKERSEDDLLRGDRCSAVPRRTGVQDFHVRRSQASTCQNQAGM